MIFYDTNDWTMTNVWRFRGSVLPTAFAWAFFSMMLEITLRHSGFRPYLASFLDDSDERTLGYVWGGFTALLGFAVGFRSRQAYTRFWEGARLVYLVRGEWFNCASSLMSFCSDKPDKTLLVEEFQQLLVRLVSLLHCMALQHVCEVAEDSLEILDTRGLDTSSLEYLETVHDRCEILINWLQRLIVKAHREGSLDVPPPILTRSFQELSRGIVNLTNVRRIRDIPFPYPYQQVILLLLIINSISTPMLACLYINSAALSLIFVFVVQTGMWATIFIANQIDQPFGEDANDLPMAEMQQDFNNSLLSLLHPLAKQVPEYVCHDHGGSGIQKITGGAMITREEDNAVAIEAEAQGQAPVELPLSLDHDTQCEDRASSKDSVIKALAGLVSEGSSGNIRVPQSRPSQTLSPKAVCKDLTNKRTDEFDTDVSCQGPNAHAASSNPPPQTAADPFQEHLAITSRDQTDSSHRSTRSTDVPTVQSNPLSHKPRHLRDSVNEKHGQFELAPLSTRVRRLEEQASGKHVQADMHFHLRV